MRHMKWLKRLALIAAVLFVAIAIHPIATARRSDNLVVFDVARV